YGSLGFLAIINIVTRIPTERHVARFTFDMRNIDTFRGIASVDHRFANGLAFSVQLSAWGSLGQSITYPDLENRDPNPRFDSATARPETDASIGFAGFAKLTWKGLWLKGSYQYYDKHIPF